MSKLLFSLADRRLISAIIQAPPLIPTSLQPFQTSLPIRRRTSNQLSITRYASTATAAAPLSFKTYEDPEKHDDRDEVSLQAPQQYGTGKESMTPAQLSARTARRLRKKKDGTAKRKAEVAVMLEARNKTRTEQAAAETASRLDKASELTDPTSFPKPTPTPSVFSTVPRTRPRIVIPRKPSRFNRLPDDAPVWQVQKHALHHKFSHKPSLPSHSNTSSPTSSSSSSDRGGWNPRRKLSPDARRGIRDLHAQDPELYTTPLLADQFKVSPEAIRRILRSKWQDRLTNADADDDVTWGSPGEPNGKRKAESSARKRSVFDDIPEASREGELKMKELRERWAKRHDRIWDQRSELGLLPKRTKRRQVEGATEGRERVEGELWRREVLEEARREHG